MKFMIGADPEVFCGDLFQARSIIGMIGGSKDHPRELLSLGKGFAVQEDNVALEFNIPASPTKDTFVSNIGLAMRFLESTVNDMGLHFLRDSAISFPATELMHPHALRFGCEPDFNAWTGEMNPKPEAEDPNLRSCGGHVHVGVDGWDDKKKYRGVQAMDLFLGLGSTLIDKGEKRKQLYGKAGACRLKPYGFEYRTLSNYWVFDEKLCGWIYENTGAALDAVENGLPFDEDADAIQAAINNNDRGLAATLIDKYRITVL